MWEMEHGGAAALGLITARLEMCFTSGWFIPAFLLPAFPTVASDSSKLESKAGNEGGRGWNCHILCAAGRNWDEPALVHSSAEEPETFLVAGTGNGHSPEAVFGQCSQA